MRHLLDTSYLEKEVPFYTLQGATPITIVEAADKSSIIFIMSDERVFLMEHRQDCCENVVLEDICGDLQDLVGFPLIVAEEVFSDETPEGFEKPEHAESYTWTFYKLSGIRGSVTLRWFGESNGYYSERVYLYEFPTKALRLDVDEPEPEVSLETQLLNMPAKEAVKLLSPSDAVKFMNARSNRFKIWRI